MENSEIEKAKAFVAVDILDYIAHAVLIKTIIRKPTGSVTAISVDKGEKMPDKISPFDMLVQLIDGKAEIIIDNNAHFLQTGESIIIPAHAHNTIKANEKFKIISTVIKSGYED
jgi:quercetin dioxygenase-like cupin family protein